MVKNKTIFTCQNCGYQTGKWMGKCPDCGEWNTFVEELISNRKNVNTNQKMKVDIKSLKDISGENSTKTITALPEFNRVMGGGLVPASVILLAGEPGIGKSTFLLQLSNDLAKNHTILYVSGEESLEQIKARAKRLAVNHQENIKIFSSVELPEVEAAIYNSTPRFVIVDSVQTLYHPDINGAQGNVSQVRECSARLFRLAKENNFTLILVGHVTKEGSIAGPRILEHLVDVVLYFEGDHKNEYRILRSKKNRYGNTFELAIYKMTAKGLEEVKNISQLFLEENGPAFSGAAITAVFESQVILMEIQALINRTSFGMPQRTVIGFDYRRLSLILAIIEKRAGLFLKNHDVFVKVTGGLKINDPAMDMAIVMAVISGFTDKILSNRSLYIGEMGLGGEFKPIPHLLPRITDSIKLGFNKIYFPAAQKNQLKHLKQKSDNVSLIPVKNINDLT